MVPRLCRPRSSNLGVPKCPDPTSTPSMWSSSPSSSLCTRFPTCTKTASPRAPSLQLSRPLPSTTPTSQSITATIPSSPDILDPSPRSRTPRRDTDPLFAELIPVRNAPWVPQAGVEPVGAPGTTPLRPPTPGTATDPFLSRDIRDFNPPDPDIAKGKGKGKAPDKGRGKGKKGQGKGRGKHKGKDGPACHCGRSRLHSHLPTSSSPSPLLFLFPHTHGPACHCGRSRLPTSFRPPHPHTYSPIIPIIKARIVIVAGPAKITFNSSCISTLLDFHLQIFVSTSARLVIVAGPASLFLTAYHFTSFYHSLLSLPIRGPACHCGRSRLISSFYLSPLPLSPSFPPLFPLTLSLLLPPRARRPPWEIQSDLADALPS